MRCLYCNKKLSLLKLAKGDSFCSSEHFDAHQLQLSKDAIQRLMNAPDKEGPKAPLVVKKAQEEAIDLPAVDLQKETLPAAVVHKVPEKNLREIARQQEAPPAVAKKVQEQASPRRDIDLRQLASQEEAVPAAADPAEEQAPPYALFLVAPPPPLVTKAPGPVAGELDPDTSSARELSFPIREIEVTACLLNLHARLSPSETTPLNWTSPRNFILAAADFPREVVRPSFIAEPDFPELENSAPVEPAPLAIAKVEPAAVIAPAAPAQARVSFLKAPSFIERLGVPAEIDLAKAMPNPATLAPILKTGLDRADLTGAIARPVRFAEAALPEAQNLSAAPLESTAEVPLSTSVVLPNAAENAGQRGWTASSPLIGFASTAFEEGRQKTVSTGFSLPIPESLTVQPAAASLSPAQTLDAQPRIARTILPASGKSITTQEPLPEPPGNPAPIALGAQSPQTRAMNIETLFPATAEICAFGQEPAFTDPSVFATEPRPALAKLPAAVPLSTAAWADPMPHRPLSTSIADSVASRITSLPMVPCHPACVQQEPGPVHAPAISKHLYRSIGWRELDSAMPHPARPSATPGSYGLQFSAVHDFSATAELPINRVLPLAVEQSFTASTPVLAELNSRSFILTSLPEIASAPPDHGTVGLCLGLVRWEPRFWADPVPEAAKLLPLREGPVLPSAGAWTPLTSLHRQ